MRILVIVVMFMLALGMFVLAMAAIALWGLVVLVQECFDVEGDSGA
jgi:hypothetical protein